MTHLVVSWDVGNLTASHAERLMLIGWFGLTSHLIMSSGRGDYVLFISAELSKMNLLNI